MNPETPPRIYAIMGDNTHGGYGIVTLANGLPMISANTTGNGIKTLLNAIQELKKRNPQGHYELVVYNYPKLAAETT